VHYQSPKWQAIGGGGYEKLFSGANVMESFAPLDTCPDTNELVTRIQAATESDRASLSRELHDEMGGLLVSAVMDIAYTEQNLNMDDGLRQRLTRVRGALAEAIDLKRGIIENLRPTLLDNVGLIEAIKWELKHACTRTHLRCTGTYPEIEPAFTQEAAIGLFRIVQESLALALRQPRATATHVVFEIFEDEAHITVSYDGEVSSEAPLSTEDFFAICVIAHRVQALGGRLIVTTRDQGGAAYQATLPLAELTLNRAVQRSA
jgi:signal transduction histidine kinase